MLEIAHWIALPIVSRKQQGLVRAAFLLLLQGERIKGGQCLLATTIVTISSNVTALEVTCSTVHALVDTKVDDLQRRQRPPQLSPQPGHLFVASMVELQVKVKRSDRGGGRS
ncbi:hypothetical protein TYRP_014778 [Tyrophagus putrescentiae]|nr:hypothetical protein TYRP_014778 [Tyrophagus putrescentiae]